MLSSSQKRLSSWKLVVFVFEKLNELNLAKKKKNDVGKANEQTNKQSKTVFPLS